MSLIDSNNFITHLVWSGLIDKATCGQLKEAIELCKVEAIPMSVIEDIKAEIKETYHDRPSSYNHPQRTELYQKVLEIIDNRISGKEHDGNSDKLGKEQE